MVVGVIGLVAFLVGLISGTGFGLLSYPVNLLDQLLLLVISGVSLVHRVPGLGRHAPPTRRRMRPGPHGRLTGAARPSAGTIPGCWSARP